MNDKPQCGEEVRDPGLWPRWHQCTRKALEDGKYCKTHSPAEVARREAAMRERQQKDLRDRMAPYRIARLIKRVEEISAAARTFRITQQIADDLDAAVAEARA